MTKTIKILCKLMVAVMILSGCSMKVEQPYKEDLREAEINSKWNHFYINDIEGLTSKMAVKDDSKEEAYDAKCNEALLVNLSDNEMVYEKNSSVPCAPASTTKLMTAYLILKYGNLKDVVTVDEDITFSVSGAVALGLKKGDKISVNDLMHGLLMMSANDCAVVLARYLSGSEKAFAERMSKTALELCASHSQFKNPHGLDSKGHYSCAYDLYLIFQEDLKIPEFKNIISKDKYTIKYTSEREEEVENEVTKEEKVKDKKGKTKTKKITETVTETKTVTKDISVPIESTNQYLLEKATPPENVKIYGGKTGTTDDAGHCLVLYFENTKTNKEYVAVLLNAGYDSYTLYNSMNDLLSKTNH